MVHHTIICTKVIFFLNFICTDIAKIYRNFAAWFEVTDTKY